MRRRRDDEYDEYDEYADDQPRRWPKVLGGIAAVALLAAGIGYVVSNAGDGSRSKLPANAAVVVTTTADAGSTTIAGGADSSRPTATVVASPTATTDQPDAEESTTTTAIVEPTTSSTTSAEVAPPDPGDVPDPVTTLPGAAGGPSPTVAPGTQYKTEADGSPLPVVAIFDTDTITLTGQVPSQEAVDRLSALAIANSQFPSAVVVNNLIVNPTVPIGVGVRVIELNSPRFPERSSTVLPDHAKELDRVATVMRALPNVNVLVIGHADQRGSDAGNFEISDARARAVVNYLVYVGIEPARLSSRAVGDADLLTIDDDAASLALNRRTEFIFYGLLVP